MKMLIPVCVALIHSSLLAQGTPAPGFPEVKIEAPPLPLIENARLGMLPIFDETAPGAFSGPQPAPRLPRRVSHMPIITPVRGVRYYMEIKKPDESVEYKLLMKTPDVVPAK